MTREEAIKKVRQVSLPKETMEILEALAPELEENEDERIRKKLYNTVMGTPNDSTWFDGTSKEAMLAYLEKQKEQKPVDLSEMMVHKEPYIAPVPTPMVADEQKQVEPTGKLSREDYLHQLLIDQLITYSDYEYLTGKKPAEWSEEDEKKMIFLERLIEYNVPDGQYGWADGRKGGFVTKSEAISMLKSLHPVSKESLQSHWKPSEEQIGALNYAYSELFKREDVGHNILGPLQKLIDQFREQM